MQKVFAACRFPPPSPSVCQISQRCNREVCEHSRTKKSHRIRPETRTLQHISIIEAPHRDVKAHCGCLTRRGIHHLQQVWGQVGTK